MDIHDIIIQVLVKLQTIEDALTTCNCDSGQIDYFGERRDDCKTDCITNVGEYLEEAETNYDDLVNTVKLLKSNMNLIETNTASKKDEVSDELTTFNTGDFSFEDVLTDYIMDNLEIHFCDTNDNYHADYCVEQNEYNDVSKNVKELVKNFTIQFKI